MAAGKIDLHSFQLYLSGRLRQGSVNFFRLRRQASRPLTNENSVLPINKRSYSPSCHSFPFHLFRQGPCLLIPRQKVSNHSGSNLGVHVLINSYAWSKGTAT